VKILAKIYSAFQKLWSSQYCSGRRCLTLSYEPITVKTQSFCGSAVKSICVMYYSNSFSGPGATRVHKIYMAAMLTSWPNWVNQGARKMSENIYFHIV